MYKIGFTSTSEKQLKKLPTAIQDRIIKKIQAISGNPRLNGYKKLTGREGYRVKIGDYRIIYLINDGELIVLVIDIDHRKQIYK